MPEILIEWAISIFIFEAAVLSLAAAAVIFVKITNAFDAECLGVNPGEPIQQEDGADE